jgi:hypothetical protein
MYVIIMFFPLVECHKSVVGTPVFLFRRSCVQIVMQRLASLTETDYGFPQTI